MPALKVFLTGASSGIGRALAYHYAQQGAALGLAARRGEDLQQIAERLSDVGAQAVYCYPLDVTDSDALEAAAAHFITHLGAPDIVIANAGISSGTLTENADDLLDFRRIFDVNVYGMVATFAPFIHSMRQAANADHHDYHGRLVGVASVAGIRGMPGAGAYSASKAAAITYLESLRLEMRDSGIKVVTLVPGYIDTPMTQVNPYPMPFMLPVDQAARRFARAIRRGTSYTVIPWPMGIVAKLLRLLPNVLYDQIFVHAPRKPKILPSRSE